MAQRHRGPDGTGVEWRRFGNTAVGLGHRRLAIQDLSEAGRQPMIDPETGDILIYNGEIYNAPELAAELAGLGVRFAGHSDTEVLLRALRAWGPEALLPKVRGMYAFAWLNTREQSVVLARDPLGIKPLYMSQIGDHLLFASEVRALIASGRIGTELSAAGITSFLAYGTPQAPHTALRDVTIFPAGCWQRIGLGAASPSADRPREHWRFPAPSCLRRSGRHLPFLRHRQHGGGRARRAPGGAACGLHGRLLRRAGP
jgi:asparagine synthase (glutamine-hydrolysing)